MASHTNPDECVRENTTETDSHESVDLEYNMNHKRRGMALIFNHETFHWELNLKKRSGTNVDRDNLITIFKKLDFEVNHYNDCNRDDVLSKIKKAAEDDHADADCFVCVFLSHGENDHIFAQNAKIKLNEITDLFKGDKCRSLVGKPKIFIWQACRGEECDDPVTEMNVMDDEKDEDIAVDAGGLYTLPAAADFIMCYSVAEGYCAFREPLNGSWYIQDLCKILTSYGSTREFAELLTLVNRKVSSRSVPIYRNPPKLAGKKQAPCFASMLTKKLFFRPKKNFSA